MKKVLALLVVLAVSFALFAGGAQETTTKAVTEEKTTLTLGTTATFASLAPFQHFSVNTGLSFAMYEYLGGYDTNRNFIGVLAKSWTHTEPLVYDIEIYDYIYDSNGNHITSEDIVFCYEQLKTYATDIQLDSVVATGDYTIRMTFASEAIGVFEEAMTYQAIISKAEYQKSADFMASNPVSTAHYMVTDYVPGSSVTLTRNDNYWQKPELYAVTAYANFQTVKFINVAEAANQTIALETSAIDGFFHIDTSQLPKFQEGGSYSKDFQAIAAGTGSSTFFYISGASNSIFADDLNLRLAVLHAIDRNALTLGMTQGTAITATMFGNQFVSDAASIYNNDYMQYDPELAKEYLAKSNYNGQTIRFLTSTILGSKDGQIVQKFLNDIGINIEVLAYGLAVYQQNYADPTSYDFAICVNSVTYNSAFWQKQYTITKTGLTRHGWDDVELVDQIALTNTLEGHTQENIDKTARMLDERAYGAGIYINASFDIIKNGIISDITKIPTSRNGYALFWAENI